MTRYTVPCPQAADHGALYDWPGERTAFYCPNVRHTGSAFYDSDLTPVARIAPAPAVATVALRKGRSGASPLPADGTLFGMTSPLRLSAEPPDPRSLTPSGVGPVGGSAEPRKRGSGLRGQARG